MRLSKVLEQRAKVVIDMGDGDVLNVTYRPNSVTPELIDRARADEESAALVVSIALSLVESWDLTDDDDDVIALTIEDVTTLPINFLNTVIRAITEDSRPNPTKRKTSEDTLSPTGSMARHRNGTR